MKDMENFKIAEMAFEIEIHEGREFKDILFVAKLRTGTDGGYIQQGGITEEAAIENLKRKVKTMLYMHHR